jgi:hypothetical protein
MCIPNWESMISISQNNQSMKIGQIKRVRFNLESNHTIYFDKHTHIQQGLSRMPTIEDKFCRWGDIDTTTIKDAVMHSYNKRKKDNSLQSPSMPRRW